MQLEAMLYDFELVENHPVADHRRRQNAMNDFVLTVGSRIARFARFVSSRRCASAGRTHSKVAKQALT
jgi:hypothetical protein